MTEYQVLYANTLTELSRLVTRYIKFYGFKLQGGVSYCATTKWFLQAVYK